MTSVIKENTPDSRPLLKGLDFLLEADGNTSDTMDDILLLHVSMYLCRTIMCFSRLLTLAPQKNGGNDSTCPIFFSNDYIDIV